MDWVIGGAGDSSQEQSPNQPTIQNGNQKVLIRHEAF